MMPYFFHDIFNKFGLDIVESAFRTFCIIYLTFPIYMAIMMVFLGGFLNSFKIYMNSYGGLFIINGFNSKYPQRKGQKYNLI